MPIADVMAISSELLLNDFLSTCTIERVRVSASKIVFFWSSRGHDFYEITVNSGEQMPARFPMPKPSLPMISKLLQDGFRKNEALLRTGKPKTDQVLSPHILQDLSLRHAISIRQASGTVPPCNPFHQSDQLPPSLSGLPKD